MMRAPLFRVLYGVTLLAVAIWFSVGTTTAHAQTIPVRLGGNASSIVGVDFELPIEIDMSARTEALGSFAIVVRWDTPVLRFAGGSNGSFGEITVNDDSLAGGALIASGVNPAGASGHVTAGILRLRPVVSDTTTVAVEVRELFAAVTFVDLTPSAVPSSRAYCPAAGRYGDVDGDGLANSRDALIALSASIGLDVSAFNAALGDVDGDGLTRARDALIILSNSVGLDVSGFRVFFIAPGACATSPIVPGFTIEPGDLTVLTGQQVEFTASSVDSSGNTTVLSDVFWQTSDETVVAISPAGQAVAVDTGTAVISAVRGGTTDSAGVTVTVVATRPNHWVDALAFNETNQLGTSQYPFATIQDGVDIARVGDTVRVRAGRYSSGVMVNKGVVVYGELAAAPSGGFAAAPGDLLPRITRGDYDWGFEVQAPGATAEIHNFRIDPMGWPIQIGEAGTVLVDNVHFQQGDQTWSASINSWGSADQILVRNSQFIGGGDYLWTDGIEVYGPVGLLDVRSSTFSDHGSDAIRTYDVASIVMRDNVVQYSGGWGLDACRVCTGAVGATAVEIGGNRFRDNYYGAVNVDPYSTAAFDHNVITGSGYSAIELYAADAGGGETAPAVAATQAQAPEVVTLLGDSIFTDMGSWLHVDGYDSVAVDSVTVNTSGRGGGDSFYEGRILTVSNSRFVLGDYGTAFYVDPWPLTRSDMIVRGVSIDGDPGCLGCSDGIYGYDTWVDADDLKATNLDDAIYVNDGGVIVRNSAFTGNYYDVDAWCSDITVENSTSTDVMGTSIDGYDSSGCGSTLLVTDNQFVRPDYAAIDFYGSGGAAASGPGLQAAAGGHSVVTIQRNITTCDADGYFGFEIDHAEALVSDNVITDCDRPIDVYGALGVLPTPVTVEIRANTITLPSTVGYTGILADGTASLIRIVGNSISGPASYGSIYAGGLSGGAPLANVDSNTIDGGIEASIWSRFVDTLRIRDNVITNHGLATCCVWARSAAIYLGDVSSTAAIA
ncbi:MAG: right-handed parallel beta-helix repeat-containing protein, partial [Gemmatimonadales bacterium]